MQPAPNNPDAPDISPPALPDNTGTFTGPVVVGSSLLDLKNAGMLILLQTPEES